MTTPLLRTDAMTWVPYDQDLEAKLNIDTKYSGVVSLSHRLGDCLLVPRALYPISEQDHRSDGHNIAVNCIVPPRNVEQQRTIQEIVSRLKLGKSFIFQAATGFGKTYCALAAAAQVGKTTLIVVTKEDLMAQWYKWLVEGDKERGVPPYLDLKPEDVGFIQQDTCTYQGKKFVLAMVHSLSKDKYGDLVKDYFGLVIFDEVHRMAAETFSKACGMFNAKLRLGLSATVDRPDGKTFIFKAHIGPVAVTSDLPLVVPKVLVQPTQYRLPAWMQGKYAPQAGKLMGVMKHIAQDAARNQLIVDFVYAAWTKGRKIIVFSDLIEVHLERLYWMLRTVKGIPAEDIDYYIGGLTEAKRKEVSKKNIILATYKMTSEATDIPWLDTAVFATPRSNVVQPMGRILRQWEGKKEAVVFDLWDRHVPLLSSFFSRRRQQYYKINANIVSL